MKERIWIITGEKVHHDKIRAHWTKNFSKTTRMKTSCSLQHSIAVSKIK